MADYSSYPAQPLPQSPSPFQAPQPISPRAAYLEAAAKRCLLWGIALAAFGGVLVFLGQLILSTMMNSWGSFAYEAYSWISWMLNVVQSVSLSLGTVLIAGAIILRVITRSQAYSDEVTAAPQAPAGVAGPTPRPAPMSGHDPYQPPTPHAQPGQPAQPGPQAPAPGQMPGQAPGQAPGQTPGPGDPSPWARPQ